MSRIPLRHDARIERKFKVWLSPGSEPMFADLASTENVSPCGVRVRTELPWKPNTRVFVKLPKGGVWTRARIAYCQKLGREDHALGLEFFETSHRYTLSFRCIHCGRHEAFANFRSDRVETETAIQERIYRVHCEACGWTGEACGFSAVSVLRYKSLETRSAEATLMRTRPSANVARKQSGSVLSYGAA